MQSEVITALKEKVIENLVGKGENFGNQQLLLFPHGFPSYERQKASFSSHIYFVVCKRFQADLVQICYRVSFNLKNVINLTVNDKANQKLGNFSNLVPDLE